jgi:hypothetical protein
LVALNTSHQVVGNRPCMHFASKRTQVTILNCKKPQFPHKYQRRVGGDQTLLNELLM